MIQTLTLQSARDEPCSHEIGRDLLTAGDAAFDLVLRKVRILQDRVGVAFAVAAALVRHPGAEGGH